MALQAERIDVADIQQARIRRAVRRVACGAAFGFDYRMLKDERTGGLCVALGAYGILIGRRPCHLVLECTVGVMAVAALHQSFIHFVMEGLRKCGLHVCVAGIAELWLGYLEQARFILKAMHTVATGAA